MLSTLGPVNTCAVPRQFTRWGYKSLIVAKGNYQKECKPYINALSHDNIHLAGSPLLSLFVPFGGNYVFN